MKKLIFSILVFGLSVPAFSQTCCIKPTTNTHSMAELAMVADFQAAHAEPVPFNYKPEHGSMISFPVENGKDGRAFYIHSHQPTDKVLLVFHEWWGLNDYIKQEAEKWQRDLNAEVYAIDLYDGEVATTQEEAGKLMGGLSAERATAIIQGVLKKIGPGKKIATIGWCMGGSWSFQASMLAGTDSKACVMYYGFPEKDSKKIRENLKTDVLYIRATDDSFIPAEAVTAFEKDVKAAGRQITVKSFDAKHAFANPSNPQYHKEFTREAYALASEFLRKNLK